MYTPSQLGLLVPTIGANQSHLAFLHVCTRAFFEALLFVRAGSIIHNLHNRLTVLPFYQNPARHWKFSISRYTFSHRLYSKDLSIKTANTSAWTLVITLTATILHYSNIFFKLLIGQPHFSTFIIINEKNSLLVNFIQCLLIGSIFINFVFPKILLQQLFHK